jgi:hypothetical protein
MHDDVEKTHQTCSLYMHFPLEAAFIFRCTHLSISECNRLGGDVWKTGIPVMHSWIISNCCVPNYDNSWICSRLLYFKCGFSHDFDTRPGDDVVCKVKIYNQQFSFHIALEDVQCLQVYPCDNKIITLCLTESWAKVQYVVFTYEIHYQRVLFRGA